MSALEVMLRLSVIQIELQRIADLGFASAVHQVAIDRDESATFVDPAERVWTSTVEDGVLIPAGEPAADSTCGDWTFGLIEKGGGIGKVSALDKKWSYDLPYTCQNMYRLYCIED